MPRGTTTLLAAALAAGVVTITASTAQSPAKPSRPTFDSAGYTLTLKELDSRSTLNWAEPKRSEHSIALEGIVSIPTGRDIVAMTTKLRPVNAIDTGDKKALRTDRKGGSAWKPTFGPVHDGKIEVELSRTQLLTRPYRLKALRVETYAVIAEARQGKRLDAVVMESTQQLVPGLDIRIRSLQMSKKRELTVVVGYARRASGTTGPFIEEIHAMDKDGKRIGGGRWTSGDPFGKIGSLTAKFHAAPGRTHRYFEFVGVTEYSKEKVTLDVKDVFYK